MNPPIKSTRLSSKAGFSLVEIVIALGVAGFCLVAMLGLIPTGLKAVNTSVEETLATEALAAIATDLRDSTNGAIATPTYNIPLPTTSLGVMSNLPFFLTKTGALTTSNDFSAEFAVNTYLTNSSTFLTTATIQVYWPAVAPLQHAQGIVETVISFNRN